MVHAGIDVSAYAFRPRAVPREGPVRALCVASLQEYKGHAVLLEALAGAPALERVELELVGSGPLRAELEDRVQRLGLSQRVRFAGSVPEDVVRSLLERADLLVLPSVVARDGQMEGLPVVLMEALASGVPVVATRLSGVPELVEDERTGLLAAPGDAADLRDALERVVSGRFEPDLAEGRALVERSFDVAQSVARLGVCSRAPSRAASNKRPARSRPALEHFQSGSMHGKSPCESPFDPPCFCFSPLPCCSYRAAPARQRAHTA